MELNDDIYVGLVTTLDLIAIATPRPYGEPDNYGISDMQSYQIERQLVSAVGVLAYSGFGGLLNAPKTSTKMPWIP